MERPMAGASFSSSCVWAVPGSLDPCRGLGLHNRSYVTLLNELRSGHRSRLFLGYNAGMRALDVLGRPMRDLRISVTDRCNFRCTYCMPFDEYKWIERQEVLSFE